MYDELWRYILPRAAFLDVLTLDFSFMGRMKPRARFARAAPPCTIFPSSPLNQPFKDWEKIVEAHTIQSCEHAHYSANPLPQTWKQKPSKYLRQEGADHLQIRKPVKQNSVYRK